RSGLAGRFRSPCWPYSCIYCAAFSCVGPCEPCQSSAMSRQAHHTFHALGLLAFALLVMPAFAGEADFEPADLHEHGNPYFGEVKDIKGLNPVENARIKVQVKGTMRFFIVQTDAEGRFRRNGLGTDVDPEKVEFSCEK